jgi:uncharacterized protein
MGMITNKTTNKIISNKESVCNNFFSQSLGLMFSKRKNLIMIFNKERKISLHNFFVFYPIDVLILNENKQVIEIKNNFKPFTFWTAKNKGKYLIELGKEESKNKIKVNDLLEF